MTAKELQQGIGKRVLVRLEGLMVLCRIVDTKYSYGKPRLLVQPVQDSILGNEIWIELSRVVLVHGPDFTAAENGA